jgi:hypothetical protein
MALRLGFFFMLRNWALRRLKLLAIAAAGVEMMTDIAIEKFRVRHWNVGGQKVTPCRDIFFILRTTSALRTSEVVTCPMIVPLDVRPRG